MRRHWKMLAVVATAAVIVLSLGAVAYGGTKTARGRAAGKVVCGALMDNPKVLEAMQELRTEHQTEMRAWYERYGTNPTSMEAQDALQQLREEHRNDMRDLFTRLGIKASADAGPGRAMRPGRGCLGACGGRATGHGAQGEGHGGAMMGGSGMMGAGF